MQYPEYSLSPHSSLVYGMAADIAFRERHSVPMREYAEAHNPYSKYIGELCVQIDDGQPGAFEAPDEPTEKKTLLRTMHTLLLMRDQPEKINYVRNELHARTIRALRYVFSQRRETWQGQPAEYTALGLLTRYAHPSLLAYRSLPHHELDTDVASHYDVGLVTDEPDGSVGSYYMQVKTFCLGRCGLSSGKKNLESYEPRYRPLIQFVSGCCDLGLGGNRHESLPASQLLIKEWQDDASADQVKYLDTLTDNLLFNVTADLLPRGNKNNGGGILPAGFIYKR